MECHDSSVFLVRKLPLSITEAKGSRIASHAWSHDHSIDFNNASVIDKGIKGSAGANQSKQVIRKNWSLHNFFTYHIRFPLICIHYFHSNRCIFLL